MPVLNRYTNKPGFYIRANIGNQRPFTYQVSERAARLFEELGYGHEDNLPWELIRPLRVVGDLHMKGEDSAPTLDTDEFDPKSIDLDSLTEDQRDVLMEYLRGLDELSSEQRDDLGSFLQSRSDSGKTSHEHSDFDISEPLRTTVESWIDQWTDTFKTDESGSMAELGRTPEAATSLAAFADHPITVNRLMTTIAHLTYSVKPDGRGFSVISDKRFDEDTNRDFWFSFHPRGRATDYGYDESEELLYHSVDIRDGYINKWETVDERVEVWGDEEFERAPGEVHDHLHERAYYLEQLHWFFEHFDGYSLKMPNTTPSWM